MYGTGKKTCVSFIQQNQSQKIPIWSNDVLKVFVKYVATLKFFGTDGVNYCKQQLFTFTKIQTGKIIQSFFFLDLCYRQTLSLCFWQN